MTVSGLDVVRLIDRKRLGGELSAEEIAALVPAYLEGQVGDEQLTALLMAGVIQGFSDDEAAALTAAYVASGEVVDLSSLTGPTVDKHSTGGVGDAATLVVAPLAAACGLQVAKLSGRGLGHTGGTLDKLEAVPGFDVALSTDAFREQIERIGVAIAATTDQLVPADRRIYALRDVTGTVASPALIAASVMSKKIAGGATHILLDVKAGRGAFLQERAVATALAELCVRLGEGAGRRTRAIVTAMAQPLADAVGNALEVAAAIGVLRGESPAGALRDHALVCVEELLQMTGVAGAEARSRAHAALDGGTALEKFRELISAQGGSPSVADDPWSVLPRAPIRRDWVPGPGTVRRIDALGLGILAVRLGAGRSRRGEDVDPAVGLELAVRVGDELGPGEWAVRVHARTEDDAAAATQQLTEIIELGKQPVASEPWLLARVPAGTSARS
ncbi:MAG: thymidine phosphorylase [Actinobacteria bacterium]|nr:thymidine phosphorylase [Actinomycetota bacterium]